MEFGDSTWPAHGVDTRPWRQAQRRGTREDRTLDTVTVSLPPMIAERTLSLDASLVAELESAMAGVSALDRAHGVDLAALGVLLLRTESVASSKIEAVEADLDDYARALHGVRANSSAVAMVAATTALHSMIEAVTRDGRITLDSITTAHAALMADDPSEAAYAGRFRDVQNWVGGSDHSPRGALYVPPPPETVQPYLEDLQLFANRDDLPVLVQAAIAHAQFESIHPFTDGNGRIGRALINSVFRRRGATTHVVVPLASALVAHRDRYFSELTAYRHGDPVPLITSFASASRVAAVESARSAERLREVADEWQEQVGRVRAGSAVATLLAVLPARPVLSADDACAAVDAPRSSVFAAINRLRDAGVLGPLTDRQRKQVWGAAAILDEMDDLGSRIAQASP